MVTDSSVLVSYFFLSEINSPISRAWLRRQVKAGTTLIIPMLAFAELGAAVSRRTGDSRKAFRCVSQIRRLPNIQVVDIDRRLGIEAINMAVNLRLRGADAVFAAVASQFNAPLVTWDKELLTRTVGVITVVQPTA